MPAERLKNLHLSGSDNRLTGTNAKLTADAGTTVDLSAATVVLPAGPGGGGGGALPDGTYTNATVTVAGGRITAVTAGSGGGGGGGGGSASLLLDWVYAGSTSTSLGANTWTNLFPAQTFTVATAGGLVGVAVNLAATVNPALAGYKTRVLIDGGTAGAVSRELGGGYNDAGSHLGSFAGAAVHFTGLSAAAHTVEFQVYAENGASVDIRPATRAYEFARLQVIQL